MSFGQCVPAAQSSLQLISKGADQTLMHLLCCLSLILNRVHVGRHLTWACVVLRDILQDGIILRDGQCSDGEKVSQHDSLHFEMHLLFNVAVDSIEFFSALPINAMYECTVLSERWNKGPSKTFLPEFHIPLIDHRVSRLPAS